MKRILVAIAIISAIFLTLGCGGETSVSDGDVPIYYDGDLDEDTTETQDSDLDKAIDGDFSEIDLDSDQQTENNIDGDKSEFEFSNDNEQGVDGDEEMLPTGFCESFDDCPGDLICDFSLGRCDQRKSVSSFEVDFYSFHPMQATVGDLLVLDGNGFLGSNPLVPANYSVSIGSTNIAGGLFSNIAADENRLLIAVDKELSGKVSITVNGFNSNLSNETLQIAPEGIIPCDSTTPSASNQVNAELGNTGPYAAGYLDLLDDEMRVFYPAECGSVRRKPISGEFPLVVILHGNGSLHIGYEYIAQILASWGFISLMPASISENDSPPEVADRIYNRIAPFIEADLGQLDPILEGLSTTYELAMIGHSRGCARMQNVYRLYPDLLDHGVSSVWLGPAQDSGLQIPGYFLVMGAEFDQQSTKLFNFDPAWSENHPPKCKVFIKGGNHSLFGDHKNYSMMDGVATITRKQQLDLVISYVMPLMQRAFKQTELWPEVLDNPTGSSIHDVHCLWE